MRVGDGLHLTYCTNIHPAVGWDAVLASLRAHAPALKARLSPDAPFGIGLRLSGDESRELLEGGRLDGFKDHVDLAMEHEQLIHIHTPHLEDKWKGTKVIVETLAADQRIEPHRVMVDHAEEHTVDMILDNGFWTGLTLYPVTKVSPARAVDVIETRGPERICVAAACDWGESRPLAVPEFIMEMRRRGHPDSLIRRVVYENPIEFLGQSPKFQLPDREGAVAV